MKIHYFQRYTQKENVATANTMLLLSRLYSYSTNKFYNLLNNLFMGEEGFDPELQFVIQEYGRESIPDATITQESFKLIIETKTVDWFYEEQLINHLHKFGNEKQKVLITLSSELMNYPTKQAFEAKLEEYNKEHNTNIRHVNTTFESIAKEFENVIDQRDYEMLDIVEDYYSFCRASGLIENADGIMKVQLASKTFDFNFKENIYYNDASKGFRAHKYLGLYNNKSVRAVGKVTDIITVFKNEEGELEYIVELSNNEANKKEINQEIMDKIRLSFENAKENDWKLNNTRFFIVDKFVETDFAKTSSGAPMGSRVFELESILGKDNLPNSAEELANELLKYTWQ